jgi:hypothetical protein
VNVTAGEQGDPDGVQQTASCDSDCTLRFCGDGYVNRAAGEICDDGNADACGTCNTTCSALRTSSQALGHIVAVGGDDLQDRETFSLSDGSHRRVVFEFDKNREVADDHVAIEINDAIEADGVAQSIAEAISRVGSDLEIDAEVDGDSRAVSLTHKHVGSSGNQPIFETVRNRGFTVTGMVGGAGRDCPENVGCKSSDDCAAGLQCRSGRCKP